MKGSRHKLSNYCQYHHLFCYWWRMCVSYAKIEVDNTRSHIQVPMNTLRVIYKKLFALLLQTMKQSNQVSGTNSNSILYYQSLLTFLPLPFTSMETHPFNMIGCVTCLSLGYIMAPLRPESTGDSKKPLLSKARETISNEKSYYLMKMHRKLYPSFPWGYWPFHKKTLLVSDKKPLVESL